jgi:two-component system chemotaxis sensor kinase CheA
MDDLLSEFLTETAESLEVIDTELVRFEQDPNDQETLNAIFRLVHTIKGTCGFLGLPRLEAVAHAGETLLGKFRDRELPVTTDAVTLVLESIDRIKEILHGLEASGAEPSGNDRPLIARLEAAASGDMVGAAPAAPKTAAPVKVAAHPEPAAPAKSSVLGEPKSREEAEALGIRWDVDLGRALRPGEVSLAELEAAFQSAAGPGANLPSVAAAVPAVDTGEEEDIARAARSGESTIANQTIRVTVDVLENLMTTVSELVLTRNQLLQMVRQLDDSEFKAPLQRLSNITAELQDAIMKTRMQPIGNAWKKLPRIVRDAAHDLKKKIELRMEGEQTELDRQVLELIKDPLTHMIRNSCDHGLESPADRAAKGKLETGVINLRAYHEGGHIIIQIADDGAGLNTVRIREKIISQGLASHADAMAMSDAQIHRHIFAPGFSTAAQVTNMSGRGVGMDVVRTNVEAIGGTIDLTSAPNRGTTFTIKIPLTLAIVSALIVGARNARFAVPQSSVVELVRTGKGCQHQVETINSTKVLRLRDRLLPLVELADVLGLEGAAPRRTSFVIVMQAGGHHFGMVVDDVFDTEEIVVKPLSSLLRDLRMLSGATILGDGTVIMIVDPNGVSQNVGALAGDALREEQAAAASAQSQERQSLLLFRAGGPEPKAVPLSLVTRLEEISVSQIERADGRLVLQYRGKLMPITCAAPDSDIRAEGKQPILVFTQGRKLMGLAVDEIVDIVYERLEFGLSSERPGLLGTAVLRGAATDVLDMAYFLRRADPNWFKDEPAPQAAARMRALLIDPNPFFRSMLQPLLMAAGYDVEAVEGPQAAQKLIAAGMQFDVMLTDFETEAEVEKLTAGNPRLAECPRLVLTNDIPSGALAAVAKTDRLALIAALDNMMSQQGAAA